jgi:membrane associated rhomboid family serine protease/antitoxin component YwqK of YwqJK toxin-antitoxin module
MRQILRQSPATVIIVGLNILFYGASYWVTGSTDEPNWTFTLLQLGALFNPLALSDEPWRIITSMFLHGHLLHLGLNQFALYWVGTSWERYFGWKKWVAIYFVTGFGAALATLWWNLFTIGVGASGAIFGMFGFIMMEMFIMNRHQQTSNGPLLLRFGIFLGINILLAEAFHADNSAHLGGLVCGMVISAGRRLFDRKSLRAEAILFGLLLIVFFLLPRSQVNYYNAFQRVLAVEDSTRVVFNKNMDDAYMVKELEGINTQWQSISKQVAAVSPMINDLAHDTSVLRNYIRLNIQENEYRLKMLERESFVYLDSIEMLQMKADSLPRLKHVLNYELSVSSSPDTARAQRQPELKSVVVFYDSNWVETPYRPFKYYRTGQRDSLGRWQGPVRDYYDNEQVQMKGAYQDDLHHCIFLYYTRHKTYEAAGRMSRDMRVGKWEIYHPNGKLEREVYYGDRELVQNVWDSLGNPIIQNGNGLYQKFRGNGTILESGSYKDGMKNGIWKGYHANGQPYFEEFFADGRLASGRSIALNGRTFTYDESSLLALPKGGPQAFRQYVDQASRLYSASRPGTVKLYFRVTPDSRITDIIIQQSLDYEADGWAKEILLKGPQWMPAQLHGQEITDGYGFMSVTFGDGN